MSKIINILCLVDTLISCVLLLLLDRALSKYHVIMIKHCSILIILPFFLLIFVNLAVNLIINKKNLAIDRL